jgi:hypothetical protein
MRLRTRRLLVVASLVGALACVVVGASATPAFSYGKATWQAALTGTFVNPGTGTSSGFWGWCDFVGSNSVSSGDDADCQLAEYFHLPGGTGWTCQLNISGTSWNEEDDGFFGNTFHMWGSVVVHGHLTPTQQNNCVGFFVSGNPTLDDSSRTFSEVDTFIPAAAGHYDFNELVPFLGGQVGEFNFTVAQIP